MKSEDNLTVNDWIRISILGVLLICFLVVIFYILYFSQTYEDIRNTLRDNYGIFGNIVWVSSVLGIYPIAMIYYKIFESILITDSKREKKLKEDITKLRDKRTRKNHREINLKIRRLELMSKLELLEYKIKKLKGGNR